MFESGTVRGLDARLQDMPAATFHALVGQIAAIDEFRGWWHGHGGIAPARMRELERHTVEISATASTRRDGEAAFATGPRGPLGRRTGRAAVALSPQAVGYAELLRAVFTGYGEMTFGEELILDFHARLLKYSPADRAHRGRYKQSAADGDRSYLYRKMDPPALRPTDPDLIRRAMAAATQWTANRLASSEFHPLLVIAAFVLEFLAIRPFVDGNGRLSRILTNFLLLQCGYAFVPYASLEQVIAERWTDYYFALRRSQVNRNMPRPDITPWLGAFLDAIRVQRQTLRHLVDAVPGDRRLSDNQLRVLALLDRHGTITNRLVCAKLSLPRETAKQVLNRLLALQLLRRAGAGRAVRYARGAAAPA